jgi:Tol biopolymer transport system component
VDREGKEEPLGASPDAYEYLRISPDGSKVALSIAGGNRDIWVWDILHKTPTKLTFDKADDTFPLWTPDGKRILFSSRRTQSIYEGIYRKSADGIGEDELIVSKQDQAIMPWSFTPDGKILALHRYSVDPRLEVDIGMLPMEGNREMKMLLQEKHLELQPQISPDGRWMAYQSHESGKGEIFVRSFPDVTKGKWQVSTSGGNSPLWSPDGRELFYRSGDTTIAVDVETGPAFKHGNPKILFRGMYLSGTVLKIVTTPWDIHPNGKKFLMIKPPASAAGESAAGKSSAAAPQPKIIVVTNWFAELKQRVPLK